jgi:hypothetical protein
MNVFLSIIFSLEVKAKLCCHISVLSFFGQCRKSKQLATTNDQWAEDEKYGSQ